MAKEATKEQVDKWHDDQNRKVFYGEVNGWPRCRKCGFPMQKTPHYPYCSEACERNKDD